MHKRFFKLVPLLAVALLATGLVAACGSDEKDEYASDVESVLEPLGEELTNLGTELSNVDSPEGFVEGVTAVQDRIEEGVADLEAIEPPSDVTDIHEDLIASLEKFNSSLDAVRTAAEDGDLQTLQEEALALPQAASEFQTEIDDITQRAEDAGVPVETSGGEE